MGEKIFFDNKEGRKLCGILENPSRRYSKPAIVLAHGYASHKNRRKYLTFAEEFSRDNIATFRFDFLGRAESDGTLEDLTISEGSIDVLMAIKLLRKRGFSPIGLIGVSFGGISSAIAASKTDEIKALTLICPVSDYPELWKMKLGENRLSEWKGKKFIEYKDHKGVVQGRIDYNFFEDGKNNIVYEVADKIKAKTLIIHGTADDVVPFEQSKKTSELIKNCKLVAVEGSGHQFENEEHFQAMMKNAIRFMEENIKV